MQEIFRRLSEHDDRSPVIVHRLSLHDEGIKHVGVDDWKVELVIIACSRQKETDTDTTTSLNLLDQGSHSCFNVIIKRLISLKISFIISNYQIQCRQHLSFVTTNIECCVTLA